MKKSQPNFKLILLRPAFYHGEEIEVSVRFDGESLFRVPYPTSESISMKVGDTCEIPARIYNNDGNSYNFSTIYMSEDALVEFIERFGYESIFATVRMKLRFFYVLRTTTEWNDTEQEEIIGCELLEILSVEGEEGEGSK